ncbi:MAG: hypothetical protein R3212_06410 [Xanthomonadales bacterium]|nr:hypothetical protein [Xanthomonadales bacterium]
MVRIASLLALAGIPLTLFLLAQWPARSNEGPELAVPVSSQGALDGLSFKGKLGPSDRAPDKADVLYFKNGQFWSKICVPCGFPPGPYRARRTDEGIEFEGILESPDRGRFLYTGLVKDGKLVARINWRKERWYWTIDKDFRFEGAQGESTTASAQDMMRVALAAKPGPDQCRP